MTTPTRYDDDLCTHCGGDHDRIHPEITPCDQDVSTDSALDPARLREFALTVEQTLAAAGLTNIERLGRIAVAHARLTQGRAEQ